MTVCGDTAPPDPPESDHDLPCCLGEAVWGPERCTCWEPEYDVAQATPETDEVVNARPMHCRDCAYLPGSPEDQADTRLPGSRSSVDLVGAHGSPVGACGDDPVGWAHLDCAAEAST